MSLMLVWSEERNVETVQMIHLHMKTQSCIVPLLSVSCPALNQLECL